MVRLIPSTSLYILHISGSFYNIKLLVLVFNPISPTLPCCHISHPNFKISFHHSHIFVSLSLEHSHPLMTPNICIYSKWNSYLWRLKDNITTKKKKNMFGFPSLRYLPQNNVSTWFSKSLFMKIHFVLTKAFCVSNEEILWFLSLTLFMSWITLIGIPVLSHHYNFVMNLIWSQ